MKHALVTLAIGKRGFIEYTQPLMEQYARKLDADFHCITSYQTRKHYTNGRDDNQAYIKKFEAVYDLLKTYDRLVYIDDTVCIHPDTPDLLSIVPEQTLGAFNEGILGKYSAESDRDYIQDRKNYQICVGNYINAGMLVISRPHRFLFDYQNMDKHEDLFHSFFVEQTYLNYMVQAHRVAMTFVPEGFNRMRVSRCETQHPDIDPVFITGSGNYMYHVTSWYDDPERRLGYARKVCEILMDNRSNS